MGERAAEYAEYHADAVGKSGDFEFASHSGVGRRKTCVPAPGAYPGKTHSPGEGRDGALCGPDFLYGSDGVYLLQ